MTKFPECQTLILSEDNGVLTVTLNRPHKRNAMDTMMVEELRAVFALLRTSKSIRALVLKGADGNFCAGGDISGMKEGQSLGAWAANRRFGHMISEANSLPQVVITLLEGAVLGGGFGLACISDVAIADTGAKMGMPETGLGLIPAQIAPFVVARIGLTQTRRYALLGEWIDGLEAKALGLVHHVTNGREEMDAVLAKTVKRVRRAAPGAVAVTKKLVQQVGLAEHEKLLDQAADDFATALGGDEGREGTAAFLEKRLPNWAGE